MNPESPAQPRDPIKQMVEELLEAGWTKWEGHMFVWKSPKGHLFRGPAKAHEIMLKDWEKTL